MSEDGSLGICSERDLVTEGHVRDMVHPFLPGSFMVVYRDIFDVEFAVALALPASNPL